MKDFREALGSLSMYEYGFMNKMRSRYKYFFLIMAMRCKISARHWDLYHLGSLESVLENHDILTIVADFCLLTSELYFRGTP